MTDATRNIVLFESSGKRHSLPGSEVSTSLQPQTHFAPLCFISINSTVQSGFCQDSPEFPLDVLKAITVAMLEEAVYAAGQGARDPVGGSMELLLVPLLQLLHTLLLLGVFHGSDLRCVLALILPSAYMRESSIGKRGDVAEEDNGLMEDEDRVRTVVPLLELQVKLPEAVKLQVGVWI